MPESEVGEPSRAVECGVSEIHNASGHPDHMPKQFTLWSLLAFAIAVCSAWIATSSLLSTHLVFGGFAAATWIPIASGVVAIIPALGLAELASAYPSSGGQYHYAFMVAKPRYKNLAAFAVAWFAILEWLFVVCSTTIFPAQLTAEIALLWHPDYNSNRWEIYLIYVGLLLLGTCMVVFCHAWMPKIETAFCWSSLLAFGTFVLTLAAASPTKQAASTVFTSWKNTSGWADGMSFLLDVGQGMWIYVCLDAATHLSEEIDKPGIHVPRAIMLATVLALVCNVAFTLAALFAVQSIDAVMTSELPIYNVLSQAISSDRAVLFLLIWLDLVFISTVPGALLTTGRLVWAFARDGGLPHSPFFSRISNRYQVPVNATLLSTAFCLLFGLIYIGSTVAFNTFISSAIVFAFLSYAVPQGLLLLAGRDTLPKRHFDLGRVFGTCINGISVVFVSFFTVLFCFPFTLPTSVTSMNYVSVVSVAASLLIGVLWLGAGKNKSFTGPVMLGNVLEGVEPEHGHEPNDRDVARSKAWDRELRD